MRRLHEGGVDLLTVPCPPESRVGKGRGGQGGSWDVTSAQICPGGMPLVSPGPRCFL